MIADRTEFASERLIEVTSLAVTAGLIAFVLAGAPGNQPDIKPAEKPAEIALTLAAPPPPPPAPPAPPAPLQPAPPAVSEAPSPIAAPRPHRRLLHQAKPAAATQQTQSETPPRTEAPPALREQARPPDHASLDALYTAQIHAVIERHKSNPQSPAYRMMHPSGTTTVVFTVSRNGLPGAARIATGSGADMLDAQAVSIVALCRFPPMPAQAFGGAEAHEFSVQITFPPFVSGD